jgi:tartrate dehydratase alpha subunit/fumarate hydratase class I-like protein
MAATALAIVFCCAAERRIKAKFKTLWFNDDKAKYKMARSVLGGDMIWV